MSQPFALNVNGTVRTVTVESGTPLLYLWRNDLELFTPGRVKAALVERAL